MRRTLRPIRRFLSSFHRDEQGDEGVNKVLIIALIAIPLVIILIMFGRQIAEWFQTAWNNLFGEQENGIEGEVPGG